MSQRLVDGTARFLSKKTSRRGFLRRAAMVGSALVTVPGSYILRPGTAYAAVVPGDCPGGSRCRDGYTEFCCSMTGLNTCPPGTGVSGWWRAEGSGYCGGGPRYYMDCHALTCGSCGCGGSGTCGPECVGAICACANDNCGLRKVNCVRFRYGQCNQHIACMGPITCRVVTCVAPWEWDSSCTHTDARDDNTRFHDAACLHPTGPLFAYPATVTLPTWEMRSGLSAGPPTSAFDLGVPGDVPLAADWTGAGIATAAVVKGVTHGRLGDESLTWHIRQVSGAGQPDLVFNYGLPGDQPVAGDWTGKGWETAGVFRAGQWLLRNRNSAGVPDISFDFGQAGDIPVVGDWNGDGIDGIGVVRGTRWLLKHFPSAGIPDLEFDFGDEAGIPVVGDWNGNGVDTIGRFSSGNWSLRDQLSDGPPDYGFTYGAAGSVPVVWGRILGG
ncbi:MAG: twin-arginine translocation signal domain-containing protein [Acidimicrobiia bacterium]|nr:twin-arginine translocation signal domain-containing protein [Acidimicrobiia bacterium]